MKLKGKVALITGAARGIGRAHALRLAGLGADIAINDIDMESYKEFEENITASSVVDEIKNLGVRAIGIESDVGKKENAEELIRKVTDELGRIDILVNNAGGTQTLFQMIDYPLEEWDRAVNVNLRGTFICSQRVGQWMAKQRAGKILNISSITAYAGVPLRGAYSPAKAGIINMTMVMAVELGKYNINVNCIAPGAVMVPRTLRLAEEGGFDMDGAKAQSPLGKLCEPDDVARAAVFLVSEDAAKITGVTLPVDAGWLANRTLT